MTRQLAVARRVAIVGNGGIALELAYGRGSLRTRKIRPSA